MEKEEFTITKIDNIMRNFIHYSFAFSIVAIISIFLLSGCKGSGGRRAATEAVEFIEKKAGSKAATALEEEAGQAERTVIRETEEYAPSRSSRPRHPHHSSYDDDDTYEPQVYTVQCPQCGGSGIVYMVDYYGNIQYDYYGNPIVGQCPSCNGAGSVLVTQ